MARPNKCTKKMVDNIVEAIIKADGENEDFYRKKWRKL